MPIREKLLFLILIIASPAIQEVSAQISPGELSKAHEFLEGVSNCVRCHTLGNKITGEKCLECHTEVKSRIEAGKGYHSSAQVKGRQCILCHNEHHGKNFRIVKLDQGTFNHNLTGYKLSTPHSALDCSSCHDRKFIADPKIKEKSFTYMGLKTECLACHADYHMSTLSSSCLNCHTPESFKTAPSFNHATARFRLEGKHRSVECIKCHRIETVNGARFQEFRGISFASCVNCHNDPHTGKYGRNCRQCHSEESFSIIKESGKFDHSKTGFPLEDKHLAVSCVSCHKTRLTDPVKHDRCTDCHTDYHKGQMTKNGVAPDCSECHSVKGFSTFFYTIEKHQTNPFPLKGAHAAQPCFACHKKQSEWSFRGIGIDCRDCHTDIHKPYISSRFYPDQNCTICHNEEGWKSVSFNHSQTAFPLSGAHVRTACAACHISANREGEMIQKFTGLPSTCSSCHNNSHAGQFDKNGIETCTNCHVTDNWKPSKFNHDRTAFRLDGKHAAVPCASCHKPQQSGPSSFILYKIKDFRCESCHLF